MVSDMSFLEPHEAQQLVHREVRDAHQVVRDQIAADHSHVRRDGDLVARIDLLRTLVDDLTFSVVLHWRSTGGRTSLDTKRGYTDDVLKVAEWACRHLDERPVRLLGQLILRGHHIDRVRPHAGEQGPRLKRPDATPHPVLSSLFTYAVKHGVVAANAVDYEEHAPQVGTSTNGRLAGATRVLGSPPAASVAASTTASWSIPTRSA